METVLLTGCAGFIGWWTTLRLLSENYNVIGIDDLNEYYDVKLKEWRLTQLIRHRNFRFYKIDITDYEALKAIFKNDKIEAVINLAARAGVRYSIENPFVYFQTNVIGNLNLLELCKEFAAKKFILASTSSIYAGQQTPFFEDMVVNTPISPYAASKKSAEITCYAYHYLYGIDVSVLRFFTVYGPAGRPDMSIFKFAKLIKAGEPIIVYGDGRQSRDFTYIDDIAKGTIKALKPLGFEIINLGNNSPRQLIDVIRLIEKHLNKPAKVNYEPFRKADIKATWANIDKAKALLDWEPKVSLEEGIARTVEWQEKNWAWVKDIKLRD